jgi:segregation and condensation protein B
MNMQPEHDDVVVPQALLVNKEGQLATLTPAPESPSVMTLDQLDATAVASEAGTVTAVAQPVAPELVLVAAIEREPAEAPAARPSLDRIVEALLFAATSPTPEPRLREIAGCAASELSNVVAQLNREYESAGRAFRIHRIAQGYQLYTLPEYSEWVKRLFKSQRGPRLSKAALETVAIVAYRQPVTRPEIEQLRGVDCSAPLVTLLDRKLLVLAGRAHKPGSPFLYRTGKEFLRYFGLGSLDDLPRHEELEEFLRRRAEQESEAERQEGEELNAALG